MFKANVNNKEELTDIIQKYANSRIPIKNAKFYDSGSEIYKKYLPLFNYLIVNRIDIKFDCLVYLTALNVEFPSSHNIKKFCLNCNVPIHYMHVIRSLLSVFDEETTDSIWESEIVEFYCCMCYKGNRNKMIG